LFKFNNINFLFAQEIIFILKINIKIYDSSFFPFIYCIESTF